MKFAFLVAPHLGGTYTVFTQVRAALAPFGIAVVWMGRTRREKLDVDPDWSPTLKFGVPLAPMEGMDEASQAKMMAAEIETAGCDGVFINVLSDHVSMNLARYLPETLLKVMIVHNISPGTYAAARALQGHVHATVCVSRRIRDDLVRRFRFDPVRTVVIDNALGLPEISAPQVSRGVSGQLRVLFLGRVDDASKGVFWLPRILRYCSESTTLTVAGDGPDLARLRRSFAGLEHQVSFLGGVPPDKVPALLAAHDALIMPSRFEGFGYVLIEAMAIGCVPVASNIPGVTSTIIEDKRDGLLFPVGKCRVAAQCLDALAKKPVWREAMSAAAIEKVRGYYGIDRLGREYARLIETLRRDPPPLPSPLPLSSWRLPPGLRPGLRTYLPAPVKNLLRTLRARA
ncbi:glycosyltransferase family 4 protein (plasmid) [Salipiger sp. H15]|uniref:Glycosyltransferase family 4 protein n=1 Tax=Alloyangia sp. H15 TaxID=3029062 RepID=A0AAU8AS70_9RHOB